MRALAIALLLGIAASLSCGVNDYCLNCERTGDGGADGDGGPTDGGDGDAGDAGDGGPCVNTGPEVCDGEDNDCDGMTDEEPLPTVGDPCQEQDGACAGSTRICVNGAITCTTNPSGELCDLLDNDCDGAVDEGNPEGGAKCGTDFGECVAGTMRCMGGDVVCIGAIGGTMAPFGTPEICDGKDNDCDDVLDDNIGALGACGGGPGPDPNEGTCSQGMLMCVGGGTVCMGDVKPAFEACDDLDNDCDGDVDEATDKLTDPQNCGDCGVVCNLDNAIEGCAAGSCTVAACLPTFHDNNNLDADGCEFGPCTIQGNEVCNGIDDDCNPATTEAALTPPPGLCLSAGECAGATASCQGMNGFRCDYDSTVQTDANGNIVAETRCDGLDNDCDGQIDEGQPNLDDACNDGLAGECRGFGTFACDPANLDGPAICVITDPGTQTAEACDAKDNDCDGLVDEGAATGDLVGQQWVTIPNTVPAIEIMKYEASRPDATGTAIGTSGTFACSKPGVLPWTNLTHPQAEDACDSIGARLCTELEWQQMCDPKQTYPIAGPPNATDFVVVEAEHALATVAGSGGTGGGDTWQVQPTQDFSGLTSLRALSDNGTSVTGAQAAANAARLDFQFSLAGSTQYFVWVRAMGLSNTSDRIHVGMGTTAPGALLTADLETNPDNLWVWVRSTGFTTAAAGGNHIVSVYMGEDGVRVDAVAITRNAATTPPAFDERTWAYQSNPKVPQAQVCNGDDFDTTPGGADQDAILPTGDRPQCFANGPGTNDAFDMSGNVKEWTAERAPNQNPLRGGASNNELDGLTCGLNFTLADDQFFFPNVGFRCCRQQ